MSFEISTHVAAAIDSLSQEETFQETVSPKERRRMIDPVTCERNYSEDEAEFMRAVEAYKMKSGRKFPTCCEVLEVLRGLGYVKIR